MMKNEMLIKQTEEKVKEFRRKQNISNQRKQRLDQILESSGIEDKGAIILTKAELVEMVDILMEGDL